MKKIIIPIFLFVQFFVIVKSNNNSIILEEEESEKLNLRIQNPLLRNQSAECECENGHCKRDSSGKIACECLPEYGLYTEKSCKACDCGKNANCTFQRNFFQVVKYCMCPNGEKLKNSRCKDPCENKPCKNGGTCQTHDGLTASCTCTDLYFGNFCEKECHCENGHCKRDFCECLPEYGRYAEGRCKACDCGKNANCTFEKRFLFEEKYCLCPSGEKLRYEPCMDPCENKPCKNGGTCQTHDGLTVNCTCTDLYSGNFCEKAKTGCGDYGGSKECHGKGDLFTCINDKQNISKFSCDCLPDYILNNETCIAKTGCEDYGGNEDCQRRGDFFICVNDIRDASKYSCDCVPGYKTKNEICIETELEYTSDYTASPSLPESSHNSGTESQYTTEHSASTGWSESTHITARFCDCGKHSIACSLDNEGNKMCKCETGFSQLFDKCIDCYCGENSRGCIFDENNEKKCLCNQGYAQDLEACRETCKYDRECLNGGICRTNYAGVGFCECRADYSGDRCEIDGVCNHFNDICQRYDAVCVVKAGLPSCECTSDKKDAAGLCESICNPNKCINGRCEIFGQDYKCRCEVGFEGKYCDTKIVRSKRDEMFFILFVACIVFILILSVGVLCMAINIRLKKKAVVNDLEKLVEETRRELNSAQRL